MVRVGDQGTKLEDKCGRKVQFDKSQLYDPHKNPRTITSSQSGVTPCLLGHVKLQGKHNHEQHNLK
jgi:hypothetical protein